jgi:ubiquitin-conjugating enzyme E2 variant
MNDTPPRHDEVGLLTRAVELASLVLAAVLVWLHVIRFAAADSVLTWWLPLALMLAALLADFVSGLVHWLADTWGSETMPVLGRRFLRPFRVHHVNPDDLLRRSFIDCNGDVAMLAVPVLAAVHWIPLSTEAGRMAAVFLVAFCAVTLPTNQVHQWAHRIDPPRWVGRLQHWRVLLSHEEHRAHHAAPYATNYCICAGWCNGPLTAAAFFPRLERLVSRITGLEPRGDERAFAEAGVRESSSAP